MIHVLRPGSLTTVQDLGRPGHAALAVPPSGAIDRHSMIRANRLAGNPDEAAVLEMTLIGAKVRFERGAVFALTGATMSARLGDLEIPLDTAIEALRGDELQLGPASEGVRTYLAVAGGFDVAPVLGSRSTDILSGIGPPVLRKDHAIVFGRARASQALPLQPPTPLETELTVRLRLGPREDWFEPSALELLAEKSWVVTPQSNRVGLRLEGPVLPRSILRELPSEGLVTGAVQVPANGQPLIFLRDHPTTGGYPVIGVVHRDDVSKLGQSRPGGRVRFVLYPEP